MVKIFFYLGVLLASLLNASPKEQAEKEAGKTDVPQSFQVFETLKD